MALQILANAKTFEALPAGAMIDAVAQARAAKGMLDLMTASGPIRLKALPGNVLPAIPDGARLVLQMVGQGNDAHLRLLAVNGRPLPGAAGLLAGVGLAGVGLVGAGANLAGLPPPSLPGTSVAGGGQPQAMGLATPLAAGGISAIGLTATVIRPAVAPGQALPSGQALPPGQALPSGQTLPQGAGGLPADLPAGTQLTVRIAGITPPQAGATPAPSLPAAASPAVPNAAAAPSGQPSPAAPSLPSLTGTVIAHPPGGQAVLRTLIGTVALPVQGELAAGATLRLEVVGPPLPPPVPTGGANRLQGLTAAGWPGLTAAGWPALTNAVDTLANGDRQAFDQLMRAIPQAGPRLAASLSVFALAQRSGDSRAVIGEGIGRALDKAGRRDLADRLKGDLDALSSESARPLGNGDWRGYTLPFMNGGTVDPIHLYVRGDSGGDRQSGGNAANDQRFVVDFALTNLGRLQLDGLVRREEKLFDLIIRTDAPLDEAIRRGIMGIFTEASEVAGTKGSVAFQSGGRWVEPLPQTDPTRVEA